MLNVCIEPASRGRGNEGALVSDLVDVDATKAWASCGCTPAPARGVNEAAGFGARTPEEVELLLAG